MTDSEIIRLFELSSASLSSITKLAAEIGKTQTSIIRLLCDYLIDLPDESIKPYLDAAEKTELDLNLLLSKLEKK